MKVCEGLAVDLKMNLLSDVFYSVGLQSGVSKPCFFLAGQRSIKVWLS